jgi:tRNA A-37 threonylcarbamoyl transferase component Bud32
VTDASSEEAADLPPGIGPGSLVAGYRLEDQIGEGGMAVVFRARHERLGRHVALKILSPKYALDKAFRERFVRESRTAAMVDDPHIIPLYDADEVGGILYIAMRLVPGGDVGSLLLGEGPLPPRRAAGIVSDIASALDAAHAAGLVHRDVKPANMLLDSRPDRPDHVYLADFGLSKNVAAPGQTLPGQIAGTPEYMAPEQIRGKRTDGRTDQYALACAAFALLTGATPFHRDQVATVLYAQMAEPVPALSSHASDLPAAADRVFERALAKMPADRYPSCREFADELRVALGFESYGAVTRAAASRQAPTIIRPGRSMPDDPQANAMEDAKTVARGTAPGGRRPRRKAVVGTVSAVVALAVIAGILAFALRPQAAPAATCQTPKKPWIHRVNVEASLGSLKICPVDVNDGRALSLYLNLSGRVTGKLPARELLVVAVYPDSHTCATDGTRGTGRYFELGVIDPAVNQGNWQVSSGLEYPGSQTIKRFIYFLAGTKKEVQGFVRDRDRYRILHHTIHKYPGKVNIDGFTKLAYFTVQAKPPPNLHCLG